MSRLSAAIEKVQVQPATGHRAAQVAVVALLAVTMLTGLTEHGEVSPEGIALDSLPRQIGGWTAVSDEMRMADDNAYLMLERIYENAEGQEALLRVQATYTRLGSLRDWSLAATAGGWTPQQEHIWRSPDGVMDVRIQHLQKRSAERIAATWFTSARSQTPSIKRAQFLAWRDRLLGDRRGWASMYLLLPAASGADAEEAGREIVASVGPMLRELMAVSRPGA